MATLEGRIVALEKKTGTGCPKVVMIICKGATPTLEEQAQIDEARARGLFVVCILSIEPVK